MTLKRSAIPAISTAHFIQEIEDISSVLPSSSPFGARVLTAREIFVVVPNTHARFCNSIEDGKTSWIWYIDIHIHIHIHFHIHVFIYIYIYIYIYMQHLKTEQEYFIGI